MTERRFAIDIWVQAGGPQSTIVPVNTFIFSVEQGSDISILDTYKKAMDYITNSYPGIYHDVCIENYECGFLIHAWVWEGSFKKVRNFYLTNLRLI